VPVAIIGGGFSGTILAAQLARHNIASVLIDGSGRLGRGIAYSTPDPAHLLNVRAENMSAWSGEPDHFVRRFAKEGGDRRGFAQRRLFGRYLDEILNEATASGCTKPLHATVISAWRRGGVWSIELDDGVTVEAQALILAVGNQVPEPLGGGAGTGDRLIGDPWGDAARAAVRELAASGDDALLIGTGHTTVDLILSLEAAGHRGKIIALSRRGLMPRSHGDFERVSVELEEVPGGNLDALWRWLRQRSAEVGWRAAVDSLRPHSHALWRSLGVEQQRRFLRHARPWWDVHRHRIAPEVGDMIERLVAEGRLEVMAGKIVSSREGGDAIEVEVRRRGANSAQTMRFTYAFNCTGPLHAMSHSKDPLLRSLLDAGAVRPDDLDVGLEVDERSRAAGAERVWALGPLTKGRYWEIIAVPDIREQAAAVADDIARELRA
jgi:uncharacterized NAD(P)/FAD-binding protein YdhS